MKIGQMMMVDDLIKPTAKAISAPAAGCFGSISPSEGAKKLIDFDRDRFAMLFALPSSRHQCAAKAGAKRSIPIRRG